MNLSNLSGKEQEEIVQRRIEETKLFHKLASTSKDPIVLHAALLDLEARRASLNMDYREELDETDEFNANF